MTGTKPVRASFVSASNIFAIFGVAQTPALGDTSPVHHQLVHIPTLVSTATTTPS